MLELFLLSMFIGLVAGLLAGLFGLGGGVLIVPALVWLFSMYHFPAELVMVMAVATSLATIVFTASASVLAHQKHKAIRWDVVFRLSPGILFGAGVGAMVADYIKADTLRWFFVIYLIYVGIRMALPQRPGIGASSPRQWVDYWAGNMIGFLSSILGIGGGTLTVPYLLARKLPMRNAVAISSACGLPIAVSGVIVYAMLGSTNAILPAWSLGYVYLPAMLGVIGCSIFTAPIGARLANKLPAKQLKRYFSVAILLIAFKMIFR